jgi:SAM-dependent methyltransferase
MSQPSQSADRPEPSLARPCPVCEGVAFDALRSQRFVLPDDHPLRDGYSVVCCRGCGFIYADTQADQATYDAFYARHSKYEDNVTSTGGGGTPADLDRLRATAADIARFAPDRAARVVDLGCANGGLLAAMKELGYTNLCGVDPSPGCARYVREVLGIEAHAGLITDLPAVVDAAEVVTLSHVLEHVRALRPALESVRRAMKPGALLYAEVPDAIRYAEFLFAPFQDFNTEHINHFSATSLANLLRANGFAVRATAPRLVESSPGKPYPAVYVVAARTDDPAPTAPDFDGQLRPAIENYIRASSVQMAEIDRKIRRALAGVGPVIVWGVGQLAMKLLVETPLGRAEIAAFVDGNPIHHGTTVRGVPVLAPEQLAGLGHPILITTTLHEQAIARRIAELGLPNRVLTLSNQETSGAES